MSKENKNRFSIFKELDKVFRGRPLIRRKVSPHETRMAMPDKDSSGMLFFQKSVSPAYSNITNVAYNISERLIRYQDFQSMEYMPELAKALDVTADEMVSQDEKGQVLHIHSEDQKIKEILTNLFLGTLNVDFLLRPVARNLVKYGDNFQYIDISPKYGVQNLISLPVNEIEREENYIPEDPFSVRFHWLAQNRYMSNWEVAHFRLIGNDTFLPYGSSMLEAARRIWRQLVLIEDAMLVYRIVRAPERRVFYIDVANIHPNDVDHYMEETRRRIRTAQVIDKDEGRVDLRYNSFPVHKDTLIPLLDGTKVTIEELSRKMKEDSSYIPWVYSVQDKTHRLVPGKVTWCDKNYTATKLVKVWISDNSYVITAPEHPFVMRDGTYKRADELIVGESLMPLYRRVNNRGYEECYNPESQKYESTHKLVAKEVYTEEWKNTDRPVVHHREPWKCEINKRNNDPKNLVVMDFFEHRKFHAEQIKFTLNRPDVLEENRKRLIKYNKSDKKRKRTTELNRINKTAQHMGKIYNSSELHKQHDKIRKEAQIESWKKNKSERSQVMRWIVPDEVIFEIYRIVKENPKFGRCRIHEKLLNNDNLMKLIENSQISKRSIEKFSYQAWLSVIKRRGFKDIKDFRENYVGYQNHKVVNIEFINDVGTDVYCMTVVGPNNEDDRHNFSIQGFSINNEISEIFVKNSIDEDYFIPLRGNESATKIDTLAGGQNTAAVEDVEYIQRKLFAAIGVPKAWLSFDDMLGSKATLSQEDIRFSRTITSNQKVVISELNKIAMIHLYVLGYRDSSLTNFLLQLSNPSTVAQMQKLELLSSKFDIAANAPEGIVDRYYIQKEVLGFTDEQIEKIKIGRREDRVTDQELEQLAAAAEGGGGGGGGGDLFGGGGGGGEPLGGDELDLDSDAGELDLDTDTGSEEPEELEAGDDHVVDTDEEDDDLELLLSADNQGEKLSKGPISPSPHVSRLRHNKSRRKDNLGMSNPLRNFDQRNDDQDDAFDSGWLRNLHKNESIERKDLRGASKPILDSYTRRILSDMDSSEKFAEYRNTESVVLTESADGYDIFIDDDDEK